VDFSLRLPKTDRGCLLALVLIYLITRLALLSFLPLVLDESVYALMAQEQLHNPTLVPTFLGYAVSWKPAPVFWIYGAFSGLLSGLLPLEAVYRLPSLLFGLLSIPPLYFTLRNAGSSTASAFLTVLVFLFSFISLYPQDAFLTDSLLFLLVCASLWLYTEKRLPAWRFIAAGALAFAAFFVKLVVAFMIPVLAAAYFYAQRRETLRHPLFMISLLAVPLAFLLNLAILSQFGLAGQLYVSDIGGHLFSPQGIIGQAGFLTGSLYTLILSAGIWFALSLFGFWKFWKSEPFMAAWYVLLVFPLLSGFFMPWYFLPVLPAMSYFAAAALLRWDGKEKPDLFFFYFLSVTLAISILSIALLYHGLSAAYTPQKDAGMLLAGRENVLVLGTYSPGIVAYKMLEEQRTSGHSLDLGWIVSNDNLSRQDVLEYLSDYHSMKYPVVDGSFSAIFTSNATVRKDSNLTSFDYVALVGSPGMELPGFSVIYNESDVTVYAK
jgi:hypothetical protein